MKASEEAFRQFHRQLRRYIQRRAGKDDAEDILQEVFLRVLRNEAALKQAREPLAWLFSVTRTVLVDHFRKRGRTPTALTQEFDLDVLVARDTGDEVDFGSCVAPLLNSLPEKYREALRFTDLNGGKQTELATSMRINLSTAKSRVQRGRLLLKQALLSHCNVQMDGRRKVMNLSPDKGCKSACC